ncbi:SseB family protein [Gryllotalpicola reticulitermitis]|uniref:SseB family protein n=1 Tax=Gryllotalpicola reticulitermitis TaxID=1184153 RepID=A0ABV8Q9S0_9MICO
MQPPRFPASYENRALVAALEQLVAAPGEDTLAALLEAAVGGGLTVDVTGSTPKDLHVRTIKTTDGREVLPLFSSMKELKATVGAAGQRGLRVNGIIVPGREALGFVNTADFVAVQFNPRMPGGIVAREHIDRTLAQ